MGQQRLKPSSISGFSVTVLRVSSEKLLHRFASKHYRQLFVTVAKGDQSYQTEISETADSIVWNETFNFNAEPDTIKIHLYGKQEDGSDTPLGQIHERHDSFELDKEIDKVFSTGAKITFKVSMKSKYESLFALVIGINEYKSVNHKPLEGCVNDVYDMESFLSSLGVPESNIRTLKDEEATREAILSSFEKHLIINNRIQKDDPILFFFAGHGSRVDAPAEWTVRDGKTETICPCDEGMRDKDYKRILGIPARTINELFRRLAGAKGNNIVAIFDSCHSGVIARNGAPARSTEGYPITDPNLDADIYGVGRAAGFDIPKEFVYDSMSSHVLLAACKREDMAYETVSKDSEKRGEFTNALIQYLEQLFDSDKVTIGYEELIQRLPTLPNNQIPQSGGTNVRRILFDAKDPPADGSFPIKVKRQSNSGSVEEYEVEAGIIHGVSAGTEFRIQSTNPAHPDVLIVKTVYFQSSILVPASPQGNPDFPTLPEGARAIVSNWTTGESILKVYDASDPNAQLGGFMKPPDPTEGPEKYSYTQVFEKEEAEVVLRYYPDQDEGVLEIERTDKIIGGRADRQIRVPFPKKKLKALPFILDAIGLFRYHLLRSVSDKAQTMFQDVGSSVIRSGADKVEMHLLHLDEPKISSVTLSGADKVKMHLLHADKPKLFGLRNPITPETNLFEDSRARLKSSQTKRYGIKIINTTHRSFYPYLLYFDPSDYSIQLMSHPYTRQMNPPLHAFENDEPGQFTIGYGRSGTDPIQLCCDSMPDTGFFKLFISTVNVDMGHIVQGVAVDAASKRKMIMLADNPEPIGGCLMAVVTVEP